MENLSDKAYMTFRLLELIRTRDELDDLIGLNARGTLIGEINQFEEIDNIDFDCVKILKFNYCGIDLIYNPNDDFFIEYGEYTTTMRDFCDQFDESGDLETEITYALIMYGVNCVRLFGKATLTLE